MQLVSIIIPTFNAQAHIAETIQSVFEQTHQCWELIVVDDCSKDDTEQVVQELIADEPRARLIRLADNSGGPATPRNVGIKHARGEFLAFLDADDIWCNEKLKSQLAFMTANNLTMSSTDLDYFTQQVGDHKSKPSLFHRAIRFLTANHMPTVGIAISNYIYTSSVIVAKDAIVGNRFSQDAVMVAVEDMHLWLQLLSQKVRYGFFAETCLHYRLIDSSISERTTPKKALLRHILALLSLAMKAPEKNAVAFYFGVIVNFARLHKLVSFFVIALFLGIIF